MAKKTKISKSVVASALVASAVIPVAAAPASAAAAPVTEVVYTVNDQNVALDFDTFSAALNAEFLDVLNIKYVKASDGKFYSFEDFSSAVNSTDTLEAALAALTSNPGLAKDITVVPGTVNDDGKIIPIPHELKVESVSAINATTLSVTLSDDTVHEVTLETALVANVATEVTFTIGEKEYTATATWEFDEEAAAEELAAAITAAIDAIDAIGNPAALTLEDEAKVVAAADLVAAAKVLGAEDAAITNLDQLEAAQATIAELKANLDAKETAIQAANVALKNLPLAAKITLDDKATVAAARAAVDAAIALAPETEFVNLWKLEGAEAALKVLVDAEVVVGVVTVKAVTNITTKHVEVSFDALEGPLADANVEVKDSNGVVVATKSTDIAKGISTAQFQFETAVNTSTLTGIWTVNGKEFNFDAIKQLKAITDAANSGTDVALRDAFVAAGIVNVNNAFITSSAYKNVITAPATAPKTLADVQAIVDKVNETAANTEATVKPVLDAKNEIDLLTALEANFDRVNKDWIVAYKSGATGSKAGIEFTAANTPNNIWGTTGATLTATAVDIQKSIDAVNLAEIVLADGAVVTTNLKASEQAKVTALIEEYQVADVAPATAKADAIKASQVKETVLKVKEATSQNTVYNELIALSNLDATTGKLNAKLGSFYFDVQKVLVAQLDGKTTAAVNSNVITPANDAALLAAMTDVTATFTALEADKTNATKKAAFKASLQKLADYTSHLTGATKFDMSIVKDENLVAYADAFKEATAIGNSSTVAQVVAKITPVNANQGLLVALKTINDVNSTAVQVRAALTDIAVASATTNAIKAEFIDLSPQAKLEVAELVKKARPAGATGYANLDAILKVADGTGEIKTQVDLHKAELAKFNAIDNLATAATATPSIIKGHLDIYAYAPYVALSPEQKVLVAQEIKTLTKQVGNPAVATPLDFSAADAVKTLKAANDIIDAAIVKVTAK